MDPDDTITSRRIEAPIYHYCTLTDLVTAVEAGYLQQAAEGVDAAGSIEDVFDLTDGLMRKFATTLHQGGYAQQVEDRMEERGAESAVEQTFEFAGT